MGSFSTHVRRSVSSDEIEDLGGGSAGTGEFLEARAVVQFDDGTVRDFRVEVAALSFQRAPGAALVGALKESPADLEEAEEIEVTIEGEPLTLRRTGWEIQ